ISITRSGGRPGGGFHAATNDGAAGNGSDPSVAPASTQVTIVSISLAVSDGSFRKWPKRGSARQGGISRARTLLLIDCAQGRTSSYVSNDIGAAWPRR